MPILKKDKIIKESFVYGGYLILKCLRKSKKGQVSYYDISEELTKNGILYYRQQFFCLMFLYMCDLIIFNEPYVQLKNYDY